MSVDRSPAEIATARIGPLSRLPAFFALEGKRTVVVGCSAAARDAAAAARLWEVSEQLTNVHYAL